MVVDGVARRGSGSPALVAILLTLSWLGPAPEAAANLRPHGVSVAVAGEQRVGIRTKGKVVLAFSADSFEGECHVGRKVNGRLVRFRYQRSGTGETMRFRMPMRHVKGKWIPRRAVTGEAMTPTRTRRSDLRQLDRCLRWMRPNNPQLRAMVPLRK